MHKHKEQTYNETKQVQKYSLKFSSRGTTAQTEK